MDPPQPHPTDIKNKQTINTNKENKLGGWDFAMLRRNSSISFWIFWGNKEASKEWNVSVGVQEGEMDIGFLSTQDIRSLLTTICI